MLFIAEAGLNHNGNYDLACELIRQAQLAGADIAKMQLGWRGKEGELNYIEPPILDKLFKYAEFLGIELMFSIFTDEAYEMIQPYNMPRYKVASRTVVDAPQVMDKMVRSGKETFISLGMWDNEDKLPTLEGNVKYLWCKSEYPSFPWHMTDLPKDFTKTVYSGYSDHTFGIETPLIAISRGAKIIEKHFTLDKSDTYIRDHVLSSTPAEFRQMVELGRAIEKQLMAGV